MRLPIAHRRSTRALCAGLGLVVVSLLAAPVTAARVVDVRVGTHPTFTRVVFELDEATGYRVARIGDAKDPRIVVTLDAAARSQRLRSGGDIEMVQVQGGSRALVHIGLRKPGLRLQEMILANPPRIVLDVMRDEPPPQRATAPPTPRRVAKAPQKAKTPEKVEPTPPPRAKAPVAKPPAPAPAPEKAPPAPPQTAKAAPKPAPKPAPVKPAPKPKPAPVTPAPEPKPEPVREPEPEAPMAEAPKAAPAPEAAEPTPVSPRKSAPKLRPSEAPSEVPAATEPSAPAETPESAEPTGPVEVVETPSTPAPKPPLPRSGSERPAGSPTASPGFAKDEPGLVDRLKSQPLLVGGVAGGVVLLALIVIFVARRRRSLPTDIDVSGLDDEDDGRIPSSGFAMDADSSGDGDESPLSSFFDNASEQRPSPSGALFDDEGDDASQGDAQMSQDLDLPTARGVDGPPVPPVGAGAGGGDVARIVQELERRMVALEAKLQESNEAREKLERQVAAQSEELRVQRAAIARTQRALRTMSRADEDKATEPALRDADPQGATRIKA